MKRTVLSVMMFLGLLISPVYAAAQPASGDTSFTAEFTGDEIDIGTSGDLMFLEDQYDSNVYRGGSEEFIWVGTEWSSFQIILVSGNNETDYYMEVTLENQDAFYDAFEVIDSEASETEAWFVGLAEIDGYEMVVSFYFELDAYGDTDLALMQFGPADVFVQDMELALDEITINGDPILPNVDPQDVSELIAGSDGGAETTPVTDEETDGGVFDPSESTPEGIAFPNGNDDEESTPVVGTDEEESTAVAGGDWESMGLVSDTEWESPNFGTSITWDDASWTFPEDYEYAVVLNEDPLYDSVTLETNDGLGYVFINVEETGDTTPQIQADFWNSPEYAERFEGEFNLVEVSTTADSAAIVYETVNNADEELFVIINATFMDDGSVIYSQISAAPQTIHVVYEQYVDGVEVDGAPLNLTYTVEDVEEISGN